MQNTCFLCKYIGKMCLGTAHRTEPPLSPPPQGPGLSPGHVLWFPMDCCWGSMNGRLGYIHLIHEALPSIFRPERHHNSYDFTCICSTFFTAGGCWCSMNWMLGAIHWIHEALPSTFDTGEHQVSYDFTCGCSTVFIAGGCWCSMNWMLWPMHLIHEALPSKLNPGEH